MGQKYAAYDANGKITAYYDGMDSPAPAGVSAIAITDEQWQTCLSQPGWTVAHGALVAPVPPTDDELLDAARAATLAMLPDWEAAERAKGLDHANHHWRTTPDALQDIRDALLADMVPGGVWIDAGGNVVQMTLPELQALWAQCVTHGALIYQRRLQMAAVIATMDREQLEAFNPDTFAINAAAAE